MCPKGFYAMNNEVKSVYNIRIFLNGILEIINYYSIKIDIIKQVIWKI